MITSHLCQFLTRMSFQIHPAGDHIHVTDKHLCQLYFFAPFLSPLTNPTTFISLHALSTLLNLSLCLPLPKYSLSDFLSFDIPANCFSISKVQLVTLCFLTVFLLGCWCHSFSYSLLDSISKFFGPGAAISFSFGKNHAHKWCYIITYVFLKVPATLQH